VLNIIKRTTPVTTNTTKTLRSCSKSNLCEFRASLKIPNYICDSIGRSQASPEAAPGAASFQIPTVREPNSFTSVFTFEVYFLRVIWRCGQLLINCFVIFSRFFKHRMMLVGPCALINHIVVSRRIGFQQMCWNMREWEKDKKKTTEKSYLSK